MVKINNWKYSWSFENDISRNIVIFGVDNSSKSNTDNQKNNFLLLSKEPTDDINDSVGTTKNSIYFFI